MFKKALVTIALMTLAACGGGGSGSPVPPVNTPIPTHTPAPKVASLKGGFIVGSTHTLSASIRRVMDATPSPAPNLGGGLIPVAEFTLADSYITNPMGDINAAQAVAYIDTSNGSTLPAPWPVVTWSTSGTNVPVLQTITAPTPDPAASPQPQTLLSTLNLGVPTVKGTTVFTAATTINGVPASVNLTAKGYGALGISSDPANRYGNATGLTWDANGVSQPTTSSPDFSIDASGDVTNINAPHGIMEYTGNLATADPSKFKSVGTTLAANLCDGVQHTFEIQTSDGRLVAWTPSVFETPDQTKTCQWTNAYGAYNVTVAGVFP